MKADLTRDLLSALGSHCMVGAAAEGSIALGDGLIARVSIVVEHDAGAEQRALWHAKACEDLLREPWRAGTCRCDTGRRDRFLHHRRSCSRQAVGVVVWRGSDGAERQRWVCASHMASPPIDPRAVLGAVRLPASMLRSARVRYEREAKAQRTEEYRRERAAMAIAWALALLAGEVCGAVITTAWGEYNYCGERAPCRSHRPALALVK